MGNRDSKSVWVFLGAGSLCHPKLRCFCSFSRICILDYFLVKIILKRSLKLRILVLFLHEVIFIVIEIQEKIERLLLWKLYTLFPYWVSQPVVLYELKHFISPLGGGVQGISLGFLLALSLLVSDSWEIW